MRITLVAGGKETTEILAPLAKKLQGQHEVETFFQCEAGNGTYGKLLRAIHGSRHVVIGMSRGTDSVIEVYAAKRAKMIGIAHSFCAMPFNAWALPAFEGSTNRAKGVFVGSPLEAASAKDFFPRETVVRVSGDPRLEKFFIRPTTKEEKELRERARSILELPPHGAIVLCAGDRNLEMNMSMFAAVINATTYMDDIPHIVLLLHPEDQNDTSAYTKLLCRPNIKIVRPNAALSTSNIIANSDLVVQFASEIGLQAMCMRVPVIDWCSHEAMKLSHEGRKAQAGIDPWYPVEVGASWAVYDSNVHVLSCGIRAALSPGECDEMIKMQVKLIPESRMIGEAIGHMEDFLDNPRYSEVGQ